ncbi:MAG: DUF11 domain-containing protein, partial [Gemmatimonadales bacterium]|nr:DUF11 domain-containing protein [Gemmatimonadales bacterium]
EGGTVVYTLTISNLGPTDATGIAVTDALPAGVAFVSSTPSQGTYNDGTDIWTVGGIANAANATLDITCTVDAGTGGSTINNTALVSAADQADPVAGNNTDTISITVQSADLQVVKTVDEATPNEGGTVVYTLTISNLGPTDATGIAVTDALPAGVAFVSSTPSQGTYNDGTDIWTVGGIANAANATLDITCTVDAGTGGSTINNTALVSAADQADPVAGNNTDSASMTVEISRGSIQIDNVALDVESLEPGGETKSVLTFQLINLASNPDTLNSLTITNFSTGQGTPDQLDGNWENLSLWIDDGFTLQEPEVSDLLAVTSGTFTAGQLIFSDLSISMAPEQIVTLVVQGQASLGARDGDLLAISLTDTNALSFRLPADIQTDWPVATVNSFAVNGLVADQITMNAVAPGLFPQGTTRNLVLDVGIPPNGYQEDQLQRLNIINLGDAVHGNDITILEGWADDGNDIFDPALDVSLGTFAFTGNRWELTGLTHSIPLTGLRIYVSADISDDAGEGRSIQMALPSLPDVGIGTASGNDGPLDHYLPNPYAQALSASNRVLITSWAIEPETVQPGDGDVSLLHILASNTYETGRTLGSLTITNGSQGAASFGTEEMDRQLANLSLRLDGNEDGLLGNLEDDPVLGTGSFSAGKLVFSGIAWTLPAAATRHLFLTGDVSLSDARDGDVLSAIIESGSDLVFESSTAVSASWPLDSGSAWTVDGMVSSQIGNHSIPNRTLAAGEGPALVLDLTVPRNGYEDDTLLGLTLVNTGTAAPADLASLELWRDGGDGLFTPGSGDDVGLGPFAAVSGAWSSPVLNEAISGSALRLFVGLTVSASPTNAVSVQLSVPMNGITLASSNSGPIDQALTATCTSLLSTAPLLADMEFATNQSTVGQDVTVRLVLRNIGGENLVGVSPAVPSATGAGSMALSTGPIPASLDLAIGAVDTFTWTYTASSSGALVLSSSAEGLTEGTAQVRSSLPSTTREHSIFTPLSHLDIFAVTNMPFTLNRGQDNVVPLTLTFLLPEGENSSTANLSSLKLHLEDSDGLGIVPADLLDQITVSEGVVTYLQKTELEVTGSEIYLDFPTPINVTQGEPISVAIRLDISSLTEAPDFRVTIEDPSWFIVHDAVNGDAVPTVIQGGSFPIQSVLGTIVYEATGLEISVDSGEGNSVGINQEDVSLLSLELFNPGLSELGSAIILNSLSLSLVDQDGAVLVNPGLILASVRVLGDDQFLLETQPAEADPGPIQLEFPSPITIPVNTTIPLEIRGNIAESSPTGRIQALLDNPASVVARDKNSGESILVTFASGAIEGPTLLIQEQATELMSHCDPLLPSALVIGAQGAQAFSMTLRHPGDDNVASVQIDSLRIACRDDDRQLVPPAGLIDKVELWADGTPLSVVHDPTGDGNISVPLTDFLQPPGQTVSLVLMVDFEASAQPTSMEFVLNGTDFFARDINLNSAVSLEPESGEDFPLTSGLTRLQLPAEEMTARFEDLMPAVLVGASGEIPVATLSLANPSGVGTAGIILESLTLRASNQQNVPSPLGAWIQEVLLYDGDEIWGSVELDSASDTTAVILPDTNVELGPGQILELEIRVRTNSAPASGGLRLGITQEDISLAPQGGTLSAIRVEAADDNLFPFWTEVGNFSVAGLAESYSNFPNPFAAGREETTFVIQLLAEGTVSLRVMTAHWRPVFTILDRELRPAGLYQNDCWDGRNGLGVIVQNGVYVAEIVVEYEDGSRERHLRKVAVLR